VVLVEASGLSVGTDRYPWSTLTVRALVVSTTSAGDSSMNVIERLELEGGGQPIVLDAPLIQNGAAVVYDTWRRCRLKDQAPSR
jgi:hypothetical protein